MIVRKYGTCKFLQRIKIQKHVKKNLVYRHSNESWGKIFGIFLKLKVTPKKKSTITTNLFYGKGNILYFVSKYLQLLIPVK